MILDYLEGRCELDALTDAERCAICAAMGGEFITESPNKGSFHREIPNWELFVTPDDYLHDGTAALRLVERFKLCVIYSKYTLPPKWIAYLSGTFIDDCEELGDTPQAAIVAAICALARAQWKKQP